MQVMGLLHASTFPILQALLSVFLGQPSQLNLGAKLRNEVENNRKKLTSIVDTVILCGCGGMALRGHGDDSQNHQKIGAYSTTHVINFIDMLKIEN